MKENKDSNVMRVNDAFISSQNSLQSFLNLLASLLGLSLESRVLKGVKMIV